MNMNILATYQNNVQVPQKVENKSVNNIPKYKPDILDILSEHVVNRRDITDTVTIPRAIFKGYLCFTVGTAINAIVSMFQQNKYTKCLSIGSSLISIYGTYNFVKGFLIQDKNLTDNEK